MKNNSRPRNDSPVPGESPSGTDSLAQSGRDYLRVAAALRRLAAGESADLSAAARDACLSPHHFQRMFRRWAGVSPQQFAACLTLAELKRRLATGDSILAAASAAGLSGVARAHDVFVAHDAATPGAFRRQGENMTIRFGRAQTPYGDATIAFTRPRRLRPAVLPRSGRTFPESERAFPRRNRTDFRRRPTSRRRRRTVPGRDPFCKKLPPRIPSALSPETIPVSATRGRLRRGIIRRRKSFATTARRATLRGTFLKTRRRGRRCLRGGRIFKSMCGGRCWRFRRGGLRPTAAWRGRSEVPARRGRSDARRGRIRWRF